MSRRFRLAAVERLRTEQLAAAARALATANEVVRTGQAERDRLAAELSEGRLERLTTAVTAQQAAVYRDRLRMDLMDADIQLEQRRQEAEQTRQGWLAAKAGLRAVEALHERHVIAWREADRRAEQKELDDLASARAIDNAGGRR
jgi:flagellar export protein FliJ